MYLDGLSLRQVWLFYFQPFWFYSADRQTDRQTDRQKSHTDADERYTHATAVDISNKLLNALLLWCTSFNRNITEKTSTTKTSLKIDRIKSVSCYYYVSLCCMAMPT